MAGQVFVSIGHSPPADYVRAPVTGAHERFRIPDEGTVAEFISALVRVPRSLFGIAIAGANGAAKISMAQAPAAYNAPR
ncbi:MAG: hypothetical protein ACREFV_03600 [Acetobacteraceae bacterium]